MTVSNGVKATTSNSDDNKIIRIVHYFMVRMARAGSPDAIQVRPGREQG